jgi:hypothetical protein
VQHGADTAAQRTCWTSGTYVVDQRGAAGPDNEDVTRGRATVLAVSLLCLAGCGDFPSLGDDVPRGPDVSEGAVASAHATVASPAPETAAETQMPDTGPVLFDDASS